MNQAVDRIYITVLFFVKNHEVIFMVTAVNNKYIFEKKEKKSAYIE